MTEPKPQSQYNGRGRPPKPPNKKYRRFPLKLPPNQIEFLRRCKARTGKPMSQQIRELIAAEMQREGIA